jgi:hypothetical protein
VALSRTLWLTQWATDRSTPRLGGRPGVMAVPRDGFRPNSPQLDEGMRIEPPPSLAWAKGTTPAAVAAAAPPDEPPLERSGFHGLRVGGKPTGSVVGRKPYSGVEDLPITISPALSKQSI